MQQAASQKMTEATSITRASAGALTNPTGNGGLVGLPYHVEHEVKEINNEDKLHKDDDTSGSDNKENASRIILLLNMVQESELEDHKEYLDIKEDIANTCQEYGNLLSIVIPKKGENGCGRVFLEYQSTADAKVCMQNLAGRTFNNHVITTHYFDEAAFKSSDQKLYLTKVAEYKMKAKTLL
ncbi:U2 small nuclear ribonucleoprotein auxiliary factor 2 [Reticulomyxa filosa]|uniref:U2 small nuclear ribonucleoprotein auxiliary factor 2 n=1 Tax=Reticulomyxa filosa TaxID=46433 RepID=X6N7N1_RETFI|nr:U2 small nuclear ribonucleoprotein auxiliary factor 2 [Reticulomyxa filosa]|eukprot:ETO21764.1 U2 small nuclear ribonucleoprotein auxiliary factor 2 [Reticulomyxa filosa]